MATYSSICARRGRHAMDNSFRAGPDKYSYNRVDIDPITFEVIRHRLVSISEEQAATLSAISGSPLVNDATDFNTGIFRANGEIVTLGKTVLYHAASVAEMIKHIVTDCESDPGIRPGDMFMVNHPYKGALHPPDVGLVAPVFHEDRRIGWIGVCAHQISVGGIPGPQATDVRDEGILIPPIRIVEKGEFRQDLLSMVLGMSGAPVNMDLDFRGFMAANQVALRRLDETIQQYGIDTVLSVMDESIEHSDRAVRERLRELPNGSFRAQTFLDHDGVANKLYRIHVTMTKEDDELVMDFTESSDQAPRFMNCTESGLHAGIRAGMLPILAFDLPWNEGVFAPLTVLARQGSIVSARFPAPVGQGPIGAMWLVESVVTEALSKLMATHPDYIVESQAMPNGGPDPFVPFGLNQYGEPNRGNTLDNAYVGGGAYCHRDGLSPQGHRHIPAVRLQNVERAENNTPMLYLYRRFERDTGGPGRNRGGTSVGHGYILHDVDELQFRFASHCYEAPSGLGLFGGYPGSCNTRVLHKQSDVRNMLEGGALPRDDQEIQGQLQDYPAKMTRPDKFSQQDVYQNVPSSGGGWGDPLEREPEKVAEDVRWDIVSAEVARNIYGVVLGDDGKADPQATESRRSEILQERLTWPQGESRGGTDRRWPDAEIAIPVGDRMTICVDRGHRFYRCECGASLGSASQNWKSFARSKSVAAHVLGPRIRLHDQLEVRMYACPSCGRLHGTEVKLIDDDPLFDIELTDDRGDNDE